VLLDIARAAHLAVRAIIDDAPPSDAIEGIPVFDPLRINLEAFRPFSFIVGVGANGDRARIFHLLQALGEPVNLIHPFSSISPRAQLGRGIAVMPGAVINTGAVVHDDCIINTSASIDHDCMIEAHAHLCPGVRLAGGITVGAGSLLGTGSRVIPGIMIGANCVIGAGSTVLSDIPENSVAVGSPARVIRSHPRPPNFPVIPAAP